ACDRVFIREGVVLNPHYRNMGLYGSEYWTYLLPRRVGRKMAQRLTRECAPLLASEALDIGVADTLASEDWRDYHHELQSYCESLARDRQFSKLVARKDQGLAQDERARPLEEYRQDELVRMKETFDDPESSYHSLRYQFVRKIPLPTKDEAKSRALRTVKKQVPAETTRTNSSRPEVAYEASE
ncbi:MAG: enoyl-CoA hydratase-related protein, partial [Wenzhouxiangellaceae bacterium]